MSYLELKGVGKEFITRDGGKFVALQDVNLQIQAGEFVSIIGHSGCGKSTLLNLVAGLADVTTGDITLEGKVVRGPGPERMVAFQNHSLLPWLTIRENVALAVNQVHRSKTPAERKQIVDTHIDMVHLTRAQDRLPSQVSGGMKQRCGIARALSTRPKVLLLDEPFGALDALTRANLQDELVKIWEKERITVVMITHDVEEALLLSDRIVMMSNGPAAKVAEIMKVDLPRPRERLVMVDHPSYYRQRGELLYFLNKCKKAKAGKAVVQAPKTRPAVVPGGIERPEITVGFVPLLDSAPFAVAKEEGFFAQCGLDVTLSREPNWKTVADGVREGRLDASQMVAGLPLAESLGLGGRVSPTSTAMTLSRGGNAITFGNFLREAGVTDQPSLREFLRTHRPGQKGPLVFGVVHPASMQNLMLRAWLAAADIDPDAELTIKVVPPPQMVANLQLGNIVGYCAGEPWNVRSVRAGIGFVPLTDAEVWPTHPEKVLGVSSAWAEANPKTHVALVKALLMACARCDDPAYRKERLPEILARDAYVGGDAGDFAACLTGPYDHGDGRSSTKDDFVTFSRGNANLSRSNEASWILSQMVRWNLVSPPPSESELLSKVYLESVLREAASQANVAIGPQDTSPLSLPPALSSESTGGARYLGSPKLQGEPTAAE
jgi:nitrate/nitrite transport system ATP-binding protein